MARRLTPAFDRPTAWSRTSLWLAGCSLSALLQATSVAAAPLSGAPLLNGGPIALAAPQGAQVALTPGLYAPAVSAPVLPTGGLVRAGDVAIGEAAGSSLTVTQSSAKGIVDWGSFSIGQGGTVRFDNGSGATLNRVTGAGASASAIDGLLSASGSVYLINPNGVIVGKSGVVDVGGRFVASTLDIADTAFLNGGDLTFSGASQASVVNLGKVGSLGGDVALIGYTVRNEGSLNAPQGSAGLIAGSQVLVRDQALDGGRFAVLVGGAGASVTNSGTIEAATAELRANGGDVYALAGDTASVIRATGVSQQDGRVFLIAEGGTAHVAGTIEAQGAGGTAGQIETSGQTLDIGAAKVDAHGGTWLLDPTDLTVDQNAANTIAASLNGNTGVTLQTTAGGSSGPGVPSSGAGDITVAAPVSWSTGALLTLDAYHGIAVNAPITATGGGKAALTYNHGGSGGDLTFALGSSLSFTGAEGSGQSLTINGSPYTLVYSMAELDAIDGYNNVTGQSETTFGPGVVTGAHYALAKSQDATGATYADVVVGGPTVPTTFEGLGHTITGLTLIGDGGPQVVGLFGVNAGVVRDIGLVSETVTGDAVPGGIYGGNTYQGGLVGYNVGVIRNAYVTGAVSSLHFATDLGGLVGYNDIGGSIQGSFSTASIIGKSAGDAYGQYAGGLVGYNKGPITDSFATGSVSPGSPNNPILSAGALVGFVNGGQITTSFATGSVPGINSAGLTGNQSNGMSAGAVHSYFDVGTVGQYLDYDPAVQTTAQLQGALPTGFSSAVWGTGAGLYPYLKSFYPGGVQAVSGVAYKDAGTTKLNAGLVTATLNGAALGAASTGANGYYYIPTAAGTIPGSGASLLAYTNGATPGAALTKATGTTAGLDIWGGSLRESTPDTLYSTTVADLAAATGGPSGAPSFLSTLAPLITATGAGFTFDTSLTLSANLSVQTTAAAAPITVAAPITLGANSLTLNAAGGLAVNAPITLNGGRATLAYGGGGLFSFAQGASLAFTGAANSGQSLSINGASYGLLYSLADLAGINGSSGRYALATNLTPSSSYSDAVVKTFGGTLEGLGHVVSGLTITGAPNLSNVGLIGTLNAGGVVRDIGVVGGSVTAHYAVGALVGDNNGLVTQDYATGAIYLIGNFFVVGSAGQGGGGLVGSNESGATVSLSYATGSVGGVDTTQYSGGLVGRNLGAISTSFATGPVSVGQGAGALVGANFGTISNAYATGQVTGGSTGLVGYLAAAPATITASYLDTQTSGLTANTPGVANLTTAQFQNGLASGLGSAFGGGTGGVYPYLKNFFPNGVQAISGKAYTDAGATPLQAGLATATLNGSTLGQVSTGANGYFYIATPAGTIPSGGGALLAYDNGPSPGAALTTATGGTAGFDIWGGTLRYTTSATLYSAADAARTAALSAISPPSFISGLTPFTIATGSSFTLDQALTLTGRLGVQTTASGAPITVAAQIAVGANALTLNSAGPLAVNAPITISGGQAKLSYGGTYDMTFAQGSSLAFLGGSGSGDALSVNGQAYSLLYSMSDLAGVNTAAGSYSALARDLTAPSTAYGGAVIGSYSGTLEGLGHTVTSLTINAPGTDNIGLIGTLASGGAVRDLGLIGGSVVGHYSVGELVGTAYGSIANVFATGAVSGSIVVGGLAGAGNGSIRNAYATGAASGVGDVGGLVGQTGGGGSITNAYATGAVSGSNLIGGLVGANQAAISNVYATGAVSSPGLVGGVMGSNNGAAVTFAYWDTQTSGQTPDHGGATPLSTAQLQGGQASGLGGAFGGGTGGLYPYLSSFFPNGVQAVSGTAYQSDGVTPRASGANGAVTVGVDAGGALLGSATTGANGYFYVPTAAGGLTSGQSLLGYIPGTPASATLATATGATAQGGLNLYGGMLTQSTTAPTLSTAPTPAQARAAAQAAAGADAAGAAAVNATSGQGLIATGVGFTVDQPVTGGLYVQTTAAGAPITVAAPITVGANSLTLNAAGALAVNAPVTLNGGSAALSYDASSPTNLTFAQGASLAFLGGASSGEALSVNGAGYTLLYTMTDLTGPYGANPIGGNLALARDLTAPATPYDGWILGPYTGFAGTLEGLGHTITGLTINETTDSAGLVLSLNSGSTIRDLGLVGGSITSAYNYGNAGAFASVNQGTLANVWSTAAVSGGTNVGGLVGLNNGAIVNAYATGAVSGRQNVGGLAGASGAYGGAGTITNAYATGAVIGGSAMGGLVGVFVNGAITNAYSTGAIGFVYGSGLIGYNAGGTVTNGYLDTNTSGQFYSFNMPSGGLTTAQLQGGQATLGAAFGGGANGLYPYLKSFFPNGVQAVSGTAFSDAGVTSLASTYKGIVTVSLDAGGGLFRQATTGANGYWYAFAPAGSLTAGQSLLAYTPTVTATGALNSATPGNFTGPTIQTGLDLYNGALTTSTAALSLSAAPTPAQVQATATTAAGSDAAAAAVVAGTTALDYIATGASFTLDQPLTLTSGLGVRTTATGAPITVAAPITVGSNQLTLASAGALAIDALVTVNGGRAVLSYDASSPTNLTFAQGSSLAFRGGLGSGEGLSVNGNAYTLLYSMSDLAGVNTAAGSYSALAVDLVAPTTAYTGAVIGSYYGTLEGLGHTITGLTINAPGAGSGLVESLNGGAALRDLGLVGGSVIGGAGTGALVSDNLGLVANAYSTGAVSGTLYVGGLVGFNSGTVTSAYAAGAVSGTQYVGGLVGFNNNTGMITGAYATGAVSGTQYVGGLVGYNNNSGMITDAYATGAVSGSSSLGGLVGSSTGTVSGYFDTQTTGQAASAGGTGLTTAQLQGGQASTLGAAFGGGANGLYPYLKSFFPNGVQAVSGTAYSDVGSMPLASGSNGAVTVSLDTGGALLGQATTGANGYWYVFTPAGSLTAGQSLLAYTPTVAATGALNSATQGAFAGPTTQTGLNLYNGALTTSTAALSLSAAPTLAQAKADANTAAGSDASATAVVAGTSTLDYIATGASFTLDQPLTLTSGLVVQTTAPGAALTVAAPIAVGAASLNLTSSGSLAINAPVTVNGGQAVLGFDASAPTNFGFAPGVSLSFLGAESSGQTLRINGAPYTLVYSMGELDGIDGQQNSSDFNGPFGSGTGGYALATDLVANNHFYGPAITSFGGTLEGLGHTITGLIIEDYSQQSNGLIGVLNSDGAVRDLGLIGGSTSGVLDVGALVGHNYGAITNVYATGEVDGYYNIGGLVGYNDGAGAGAKITNAYATGPVSGSGTIGGLVGNNDGASGTASITNAYANGTAAGVAGVGGLVGSNDGGGASITNAYATGATSSQYDYVGGLVAVNADGAHLTNVYATGAVSGGAHAGGLIGFNNATVGNGYYDSATTGRSLGIGVDNSGQTVTPLTTAQFQGTSTLADGSRFSTQINLGDGATSAFGGGANGLYPYLKSFFPNGVQAVSGTVYQADGVTPSMATPVALLSGGSVLNPGGASSGANGYWYAALPVGTLATSGLTLGEITCGCASAARYAENLAFTGAVLSGQDLVAGLVRADTQRTSLSALQSDLTATFGPTAIASFAPLSLAVNAAAGFTIDQALNVAGANQLSVNAAAGRLAITAPVTLAGGGAVILRYGSSFGVTGAGKVDYGSTDQGGTLSINGAPYTLIYRGDLSGMAASGNYALASSASAPTSAYGAAVVATFGGTLEGLGNTLSGLTINATGSLVGLFGHLTATALVQDLTLSGASVSGAGYTGVLAGDNEGRVAYVSASGTLSGGSGVGGLVGVSEAGSQLTNVSAAVTVNGSDDTGGLVGLNRGSIGAGMASGGVTGTSDRIGGLVGQNEGAVSGSASGAVSGRYLVGGLVGLNFGSVVASSASGAVSATAYAGGLLGWNTSAATTGSSTATGQVAGTGDYIGGLVGVNEGAITGGGTSLGQVSGGRYVGGLVGWNLGGILGGANAAEAVTASGDAAGGLVGENDGSISFATASGAVTGTRLVGGLVGNQNGAGSVANASASGNATGSSDHVGGLVGYNAGAVTASSATGAASGRNFVGGLIGLNFGAVSNASASGAAGGANDVGGLIGGNTAGATTAGSTATGPVAATGDVAGGLVGLNQGAITGGGSSVGQVSGGVYVGGLVGLNGGSIASSNASNAVSGSGDAVGGLVGENDGSVTAARASGAVVGGRLVGGLIGYQSAGGTVSNAVALGTASSTGDDVGGLIGYNSGTVSGGAQARGAASGANNVGGLIGYNAGAVSDSEADGSVQGSGLDAGGLIGANISAAVSNTVARGAVTGTVAERTGGLIGYSYESAVGTSYAVGAVNLGGGLVGTSTGQGATLTSDYWDVGTTGQAVGVVLDQGSGSNVTGVGGGTGRNPYAAASYAGFDFTAHYSAHPGMARPTLIAVDHNVGP